MEAVTGSFTPLLIVISMAFIVPLLLTRFQRLKLPLRIYEADGLGIHAAEQLVGHHEQVVIVAKDANQIARAGQRTPEGIAILHADINERGLYTKVP